MEQSNPCSSPGGSLSPSISSFVPEIGPGSPDKRDGLYDGVTSTADMRPFPSPDADPESGSGYLPPCRTCLP